MFLVLQQRDEETFDYVWCCRGGLLFGGVKVFVAAPSCDDQNIFLRTVRSVLSLDVRT